MHHVFHSQPWIFVPEPARVRALYEAHGRPQRVPRGGTLKREGEPARLFFLLRGLCGYLINEDRPRSQILGLILPGRSMGDVTCLTGRRVNVHTVALRESEVLTLRPQILQEAMRADCDMALTVARATAIKLECAMEGMMINNAAEPHERLAVLMRTLLNAFPAGVQPGFNPLPLGLSTEELAAVTHTTRVTVSRVLSRWQAQALVRKAGRSILVSDRLFDGLVAPTPADWADDAAPWDGGSARKVATSSLAAAGASRSETSPARAGSALR